MDVRALLALAYLIIGFGMLFVIGHVRAGKHVTLSVHAATNPLAYFVFGLCLSLGMLSLSYFAVQWLVPHYGLPPLFLLVFFMGVASVVAVAWIPDKGATSRLHHLGAYCIVACQAAIITIILATAALSPLARLVACAMLLAMLVICCLLFFKVQVRRSMLVLEMLVFMAFPAALLAVTYL